MNNDDSSNPRHGGCGCRGCLRLLIMATVLTLACGGIGWLGWSYLVPLAQ